MVTFYQNIHLLHFCLKKVYESHYLFLPYQDLTVLVFVDMLVSLPELFVYLSKKWCFGVKMNGISLLIFGVAACPVMGVHDENHVPVRG